MLVYDTLRRRRRFFGDTCSLRDSMREKIGIVAFLFLSSLRGAFSHEPSSSYRESRYRFRISERRCKARGIHVFLNERNVDANGRSRISITSAWNEALSWNPRTTRSEPSFIPFRECHGERKKKSGTSTIHQEHFDARWKRSDFPLVRILYRRDRRGSFDMCVWKFNSIDPRVNPNDARPIIGITELSWIYRGLIVAPSRIRRTETWKGRNDTRTGSSIILESEFSRNFGIWDIFRKILLTSPRLKTCYVRLENERKRFGIVINYRYERGISNRKVKSSRAFRMERCGTAIFSKSGNRFCKAVYKQFPWKRNKSFCHRSDCWSANRQMAMEARGKYFPSCFRGELNRNKVTIASPVVNTDLSLFNTIRDIAIVWHPRRLCDFPIKMFIGRETFFFCRIRVVFSIVEGFANDTFFQMME